MRKNRYRSSINKKRLILKGLLLFATLFVFGIAFFKGYFLLINHPYFQIKEIKITGNKRLSKNELLTWINLSPHQSLLSLHLSLLKRRLISHPAIEEVNIYRKWPDKLIISLKEREPVALIYDDAGVLATDKGGFLFHMRDYPNLPIIKGAYKDRSLLREAINLLIDLKDSSLKISELHLDQDLGITFYTNGIEVYLGRGDYERKLCSLHKVLAYLDQIGLEKIKRIDLNRVKKVCVRFEG